MQIVGTGLMARCVQHETDHLDGVLFVDRLDPQRRKEAMREIRQAEWYDLDKPAGGQAEPARDQQPLRSGAVTGMRLVFAGTPAVAVPALDAIAASGHELVAVVTRPDAPAGRGRGLVRSPVGAWADERGIEVLTPARPREPEFQRAAARDRTGLRTGGRLRRPGARRRRWRSRACGWVNLHFSLLPAWRGAAPVQHAVLHGDEVTGASVFQLEEGLDTGPVFGTLTDEIRPGRHLRRPAGAAGALRAPVCWSPSSTRSRPAPRGPRPQPADGVSLAPKLTVEDAQVRWGDPAFARRPPDPRLHAGAGRVDDLPRRPGQARPGQRRRRRPGAQARRAAGGEVPRPGGHRHHAGARWARSGRPARRRWPPPTGPAASASPRGSPSHDGSRGAATRTPPGRLPPGRPAPQPRTARAPRQRPPRRRPGTRRPGP